MLVNVLRLVGINVGMTLSQAKFFLPHLVKAIFGVYIFSIVWKFLLESVYCSHERYLAGRLPLFIIGVGNCLESINAKLNVCH